MPVALVKIADNFSLKQIKGGEQSRRSVPLVIVRHGSATPFLQGQAGLGAVQSLNLAFLIHAEHNGLIGRVEIEADDVRQLFEKLRIARDSLNVLLRCGLMLWLCQRLLTVDLLMP
jgi:hypothetical protein